MTHADMVYRLDKKYSEKPVPCPNEGIDFKLQHSGVRSEHGALAVHGTGQYLVCGVCDYKLAVGILD